MNNELNCLLSAMRDAGNEILHLQKNGFAISKKSGNQLVTQADLAANKILKTALLNTFPDYGWLSEECADDASRLQKQRVWIVDPIDGTIEFARGIREYAISVALVEDGVPVLAAIFNPATDELFHAIKGQGAWHEKSQLLCKRNKEERLTLLASRSEDKRGKWDAFKADNHVEVIGSIAYKLGLLAAGKGDATFSLSPKNEWDIAAGVLLVQEAGGKVTDKEGKAFQFNQAKTKVSGIIAASESAYDRVFELTHDHA